MTLHKDMERAEKLARELRVNGHINIFVPVPGDGPSVAKIDSEGVDAIASLIAQVRNETLEVAADHMENFAAVVELMSTRTNAIESADDLRVMAKSIRNLKQEDKE